MKLSSTESSLYDEDFKNNLLVHQKFRKTRFFNIRIFSIWIWYEENNIFLKSFYCPINHNLNPQLLTDIVWLREAFQTKKWRIFGPVQIRGGVVVKKSKKSQFLVGKHSKWGGGAPRK